MPPPTPFMSIDGGMRGAVVLRKPDGDTSSSQPLRAAAINAMVSSSGPLTCRGNMALVATMLWERLDVPGHDACRLERHDGSWEIRGHAIFEHEGKPCSLSYSATCGEDWRTDRAAVAGWLGTEQLNLEVRRAGADWSLNGRLQPEVSGCIDLDLGFSPATNLIAIRRLELGIGEESPAPAAYLSFPELRLDLLEQLYRRTGAKTYAYSAPAFGYDEALEVSDVGFVVKYPSLWEGRILRLG